MLINAQQKIGIWGFGIVGKSLVNFALRQNVKNICIMERRQLTEDELIFLRTNDILLFHQDDFQDFFAHVDVVIPSPGIDLRGFELYKNKFVAELDIFHQAWQNRAPIIAITGTLGKTSVTHILSQLLKIAGKKVLTAGNIGTGMLDVLDNAEPVDYVVLELSSYQLEHVRFFAPDLAILTNFYPKHLDRHANVDEYFRAKSILFKYRCDQQRALIPHSLSEKIKLSCAAHLTTFSEEDSAADYFFSNEHLLKKDQKLFLRHDLPTTSFPINWLIITAALDMLGFQIGQLIKHNTSIDMPKHRLDLVAKINEIEFYDDAKSTAMEATLAAVERLQQKPVILLLGGLSDAGDRAAAIKKLSGKVRKIICFGAEADYLTKVCQHALIDAVGFNKLEEAVHAAYQGALPGNCIVLSPGGPSFDLFKDYTERGNRFRSLVMALAGN